MTWGAVDLERGEITVQAGRVLLDGHRTAIDDPKSTASRRTVPVEQIRPGTVALLRALKARQAADRLGLGPGYPETDLVVVDAIGQPSGPSRTRTASGSYPARPSFPWRCFTRPATRWP
jgi:hypothetical protein